VIHIHATCDLPGCDTASERLKCDPADVVRELEHHYGWWIRPNGGDVCPNHPQPT
jgi:hypothetical protein